MSDPPRPDVADALATLTGGDDSAAARLLDLVYAELRAIAGNYFRRHGGAHTLQPTALVHEAYLKVTDKSGVQFADRGHFLAVCAVAMRSILADHSKAKRRLKRGGEWRQVGLTGIDTPGGGSPIDALALDEALTRLAARSERQARIVEYRFFSGMTVEEIAPVLGISRATVEREWRMARAWLMVQLDKAEPE